MNDLHLHEDEIQKILDKNRNDSQEKLPPHLAECQPCAALFEQYRSIYCGLNRMDFSDGVSPEFTSRVLDRIPSFETETGLPIWFLAGLGMAGVVVFAAVCIFYFGWGNVISFLNSLMKPVSGGIHRVSTIIKNIRNEWFAFFLGGAALLTMTIADRFLRRLFQPYLPSRR